MSPWYSLHCTSIKPELGQHRYDRRRLRRDSIGPPKSHSGPNLVLKQTFTWIGTSFRPSSYTVHTGLAVSHSDDSSYTRCLIVIVSLPGVTGTHRRSTPEYLGVGDLPLTSVNSRTEGSSTDH